LRQGLNVLRHRTQLMEQLLRGRVGGEACLDRGALVGRELAVEIRAQQLVVRFEIGPFIVHRVSTILSMCNRGVSRSRISRRARNNRLRTVPTGKSRISAISSYRQPSISRSTKIWRCSKLSSASAAWTISA